MVLDVDPFDPIRMSCCQVHPRHCWLYAMNPTDLCQFDVEHDGKSSNQMHTTMPGITTRYIDVFIIPIKCLKCPLNI